MTISMIDTKMGFGQALLRIGKIREGIKCFQQIVDQDATMPEAHFLFGKALRVAGDLKEAICAFQNAIRLNPEDDRYWFYMGMTMHACGDIPGAAECFEKAAQLDPDDARYHADASKFLLSAVAKKEQLPEFSLWMTRHHYKSRSFSQPSWDGRSLDGKSLLVYTEQGIGDIVQLIRYMPLVQKTAWKVYVQCRDELLQLLRYADGMKDVILLSNSDPLDTISFDVRICLSCLPLLFRTEINTIPRVVPYISAPQHKVLTYKCALQSVSLGQRKVGIRWAGSSFNASDRHRSCHARDFLPLTSIPDIHLFSLQRDDGLDQLSTIPLGLISDLSPDLKDLVETASIISALDLVITVDTSMAHLAGALGKPVWLLLANTACRRYASCMSAISRYPWYPTATVFRQLEEGNWRDPLQLVQQALTDPAKLKLPV